MTVDSATGGPGDLDKSSFKELGGQKLDFGESAGAEEVETEC